MEKIDLANWERTLHYQIFRNSAGSKRIFYSSGSSFLC